MATRYYELLFDIDSSISAKDLEMAVEGAAFESSRPITVLSATVHNRPPSNPADGVTAEGTVYIKLENADPDTEYEFNEIGGGVARRLGVALVNELKVGTGTLGLKGDPDAIDEFLGGDGPDVGGGDVTYTVSADEFDDDVFDDDEFQFRPKD